MKPYFPFQWHITDECDQRCKHCYIFSENCNKTPDAMTWQQMQDTFYNCLDFCQMYDRLPYFYITGGDPILHPDFWRLLELLKAHDIPFTILGNPFHLTDEVCQRLKGLGCEKYQLSLDGMRETHDWFRKPGSFDITLEKIACIKKAGIRSVIRRRSPVRTLRKFQKSSTSWWRTRRIYLLSHATVPPATKRTPASSLCNTGNCLPSAIRNSRNMKR